MIVDQTIFNTLSTIQGAGSQPSLQSQQSLAEEYRKRQKERDERLMREIESHKIGAVLLPKDPSQGPGKVLQPISGQEN